MALFIQGTACSICGEVVKQGNDLVSTTHFITDGTHPLWRYSDSVMHRACFVAWEHRQEFVNLYNQTIGSITWGNGTYHHILEDGTIETLKRK